MATRTLSRRALRDQHAASELSGHEPLTGEGGADKDPPKPRGRRKAAKLATPVEPKTPAKPRIRKKVVKVTARAVARWAVFDNTAKRIAVFEYKDRADADAKLAEVRDRKPGTYFLTLVKDPYDPPVEPVDMVGGV